jgi:hypothetical protein
MLFKATEQILSISFRSQQISVRPSLNSLSVPEWEASGREERILGDVRSAYRGAGIPTPQFDDRLQSHARAVYGNDRAETTPAAPVML